MEHSQAERIAQALEGIEGVLSDLANLLTDEELARRVERGRRSLAREQ